MILWVLMSARRQGYLCSAKSSSRCCKSFELSISLSFFSIIFFNYNIKGGNGLGGEHIFLEIIFLEKEMICNNRLDRGGDFCYDREN